MRQIERVLMVILVVGLTISVLGFLHTLVIITGRVVTTNITVYACIDTLPTITQNCQTTAWVDYIYYCDIDATDSEVLTHGQNLTLYDNSTLFAINSTTGVILFTPNSSQVGSHSTLVWVDDGAGCGFTESAYTLTVGWVPGTSCTVCTNFETIEANTTQTMDVDNELIYIIRIEFIATSNLTDARLCIQNLPGRPEGTTVNTLRTFQYVNITQTNLSSENLSQANITFIISKSWLTDNGISNDNAVLLRYANNTWNELETTFVSEGAVYNTFVAESPGFSYFALAGKEPAAAAAPAAAPAVTTIVGGGGKAIEYVEAVTVEEKELLRAFKVRPDKLSFSLHAGESETDNLVVENTGDLDLSISLKVKEDYDFVSIDKFKTSLRPGAREKVKVTASVPSDHTPGTYLSFIVITQGGHDINFPVVVEILPEEAAEPEKAVQLAYFFGARGVGGSMLAAIIALIAAALLAWLLLRRGAKSIELLSKDPDKLNAVEVTVARGVPQRFEFLVRNLRKADIDVALGSSSQLIELSEAKLRLKAKQQVELSATIRLPPHLEREKYSALIIAASGAQEAELPVEISVLPAESAPPGEQK